MNGRTVIQDFLSSPAFAVVGASNHMEKYGAKVFACYLQKGRKAYAVHPTEKIVQGHPAYPSLEALPETVRSVSVITPPSIAPQVVDDAIGAGVSLLWFQPGADSQEAVERAERAGVKVIHGGPCLLVVLGYRE